MDYEIYSWSDADKYQVKREMKLKTYMQSECVVYMFDQWKDFQRIFDDELETGRQMSLEDALNMCGISFTGRKHDALYDARNTSELFCEWKSSNLSACVKKIQRLTKDQDEDKVTLGDLFDFASLKLD